MGFGFRARKVALDSFADQVRQDKAPARKKSGKKGVKCGRGWISPDKDCEPQKGKSLKQKPESRRSPKKGGFDPSTGYAIAAGLLGISALSGGAAAVLEAGGVGKGMGKTIPPPGIGRLSEIAKEQVSKAEEEVRSGQKKFVALDGETGERIFETDEGSYIGGEESIFAPRKNIAIVVSSDSDIPSVAFGRLMAEANSAAKEGVWDHSFVSAVSGSHVYRFSMDGEAASRELRDPEGVERMGEEAYGAAREWAAKNDLLYREDPEAAGRIEDRYYAEVSKRSSGFKYESSRHKSPSLDSLFFDSYPRWDAVDGTLKGGVGNAC